MKHVSRRDTLKLLAAASATGAVGCALGDAQEEPAAMSDATQPSVNPILGTEALGFPWPTADPFLFCVHHDDAYPEGNDALGPKASLAGRNLGQDFTVKDGWRMYHGRVIPGFPQHPHRGFETVTVVRRGLLDHSDSMGATARYGQGDVQWLTAGQGILHAEMFPLLKAEAPNPLELFQIWLNLPGRNKMVDPHFTMLWDGAIPTVRVEDNRGRATEVRVVAGRFGDATPGAPPPHSWAADPANDVAIWTLKMAPGAELTLPAGKAGSNRSIYIFAGDGVTIAGEKIPNQRRVRLRADVPTLLVAGAQETEILLLQGQPIGEPVAHHGPFVMNSVEELRAAFDDYRRTQFGGWPWERDDHVHPRDKGRFARHADGREEEPA